MNSTNTILESRKMKVLLLSDIPPCSNLTAGLVLSAMTRFLPRDSICCFAVVNSTLDIKIPPEFGNIPVEFHAKPNENWAWLPQRRLFRKLSSLISFLGERIIETTSVRSLTNKAVKFGKEQNVDRVWAVLQGQTTIRMAKQVADELQVPLHTHVWDPFSWWAEANKIDGISTRRIQALFDDAISSSAAVATASAYMADNYRERFNVDALPIISSHPKSLARTPDIARGVGDSILIGMAGQFYAASEWLQLIRAMDAANWRVAGKDVRIVVLGPQKPPQASADRVAFLGWKSQQDAAEILSHCDLLYCPYPFDPKMREVAMYSFPSKLVLYLAAGRPIVFHGPDYSSPCHYIRQKECGVVADRLVATAVFNEIERLVADVELYKKTARNAQAAFVEDFTLESMAKSFHHFIGTQSSSSEMGGLLHHHGVAARDAGYPTGLSEHSKHRSFAWSVLKYGRLARDCRNQVRNQLTHAVRVLALKVSRLKSSRHEILSLYAEKERLTKNVAELSRDNARLKDMLRNVETPSDIAATGASKIFEEVLNAATACERVADIQQQGRKRTFVSSLERLVGIGAELAVKSAAPNENGFDARLMSLGSVSYICLSEHGTSGLDAGRATSEIDAVLDQGRRGTLLRLMLQDGAGEIAVFADDRPAIEAVLAIAELIGLPVTVLSKGGKRLEDEDLFKKRHDFVKFLEISDLPEPKFAPPEAPPTEDREIPLSPIAKNHVVKAL